MYNRTFFLVVLVFTTSILMTACGQEETEWKGSIEEVDGIVIVRNPIEPLYEGEIITLEEELNIGKESGEGEPAFIRIWAMQVDDKGNIYVLDSKPYCIKIFNSKGELIRQFGNEGQGPGEWSGPRSFLVLSNGNIVVCDSTSKKLCFYSNDGEWARDISTVHHSSSIIRIHVDSSEYIYALSSKVLSYSNTQYAGQVLIEKFDLDFNFIKSIVTFDEEITQRNIITPHGPRFWEIVIPDDYVVWAVSSKYELHFHNQEGQEAKRIIKDFIPIRFTEDEKKRVIDYQTRGRGYPEGYEVSFPDHYNPLAWRFIADDEGRLIVETTARDSEDNHYNDIFDSEGRFITRISLKYRPIVWKKGKVYCIEVDEEGYQYVKRYKVTWKI
jgi:hypothetical protein